MFERVEETRCEKRPVEECCAEKVTEYRLRWPGSSKRTSRTGSGSTSRNQFRYDDQTPDTQVIIVFNHCRNRV